MQVSVLGPFANSPEMLLGNYYGSAAGPVTTPYEAIKVCVIMLTLRDMCCSCLQVVCTDILFLSASSLFRHVQD